MEPLVAELADLYRLAASASVDDFPDTVLGRLGRWIEFDGAVFGFGEHHTQALRIATASVHRRDPAILEDYARVSHADPVTAAFLGRPLRPIVVDARATYAGRRHRGVADFAMRHELRHLLLYGDQVREHGPLRWVVLYRGNDEPFDCAASERLWVAWQHVACALDLNRAQTLDREEARRPSRSLALVDAHGTIEAGDPGFHALLAGEWSEVDVARLPRDVVDVMVTGERFQGRSIEIGSRRLGAHVVCHARPRRTGTQLSARERLVAKHFAPGMSHKEVAQLLQVSPNTVRAQLAQVYRKLGIGDKAALAVRLAQDDP